MIKTLVVGILFSVAASVAVAGQAEETQGITDTQILLGSTQTLSGFGAAVKGSQDAQAGMDAYIKRVNDGGGIFGRKLKLTVLDHNYQMPKAIELTKKLVEEDKIFALVAPMSTSVMVATRPYVNRVGIPEVGPIDGDPSTRTPFNPTIFHARPSFTYECQAVLRYIRDHLHIKDVAIFRPNSALGEALRLTYIKVAHDEGMNVTAVASEGSQPGDLDEAIKTIVAANPKVVIMAGPAVANNRFLKRMSATTLKPAYFANSPSMDVEALQGVTGGPSAIIVSSGFPAKDNSYSIIRDYNEDIKKIRPDVGPIAIESYFGTAVLVEGLKRTGAKLTRHKFIEAMDSMHGFDLGGIPITFNSDDHDGIKQAWLLKVTKDSVTTFDPERDKL